MDPENADPLQRGLRVESFCHCMFVLTYPSVLLYASREQCALSSAFAMIINFIPQLRLCGQGVIFNFHLQPPMPPRLSKRQQREQEEIAALTSAAKPVEDIQAPASNDLQESESDDASQPVSKRPIGQLSAGFSIVGVFSVILDSPQAPSVASPPRRRFIMPQMPRKPIWRISI